VLRLDVAIGRAEAILLAMLVLALTAVTFAQVVERYVFSDPLIWSEEAARYLFVWVTLVGAALGLRESGHYGLDVLVRRVPASTAARRVLGMLATAIVAAFLVVFMFAGIAETRQAALQEAATLPIRMHWPYLALRSGPG
jgi:TRAP-type C4-dicarboxylate transport system permease small subunit